jgi:hypothetical protein
MESVETATWIVAISTALYAITVLITVFYVKGQLKENRLLREANVLKDAYDYVIRTHQSRKIVYANETRIKTVNSVEDLQRLGGDVRQAIHEVANCYHYIGFLMKSGLLTNKSAFFEEGGDTFDRTYQIIKSAITQERRSMPRETYKQYLEYLLKEMEQYRRGTQPQKQKGGLI